MNKNIQDERFLVAEEAICQAFYEIAQKKTLERITVSDVIKKAGIVRSTFYNHYEGIPDLLDAVEDQTIHHLFTMMDQFHVKKSTPQDNSVIILRFIRIYAAISGKILSWHSCLAVPAVMHSLRKL